MDLNTIRDEYNHIQTDIDVSVCVMTYFHENTICQALDSVLAQQTHYKYEIVISDDCSQDGTVDILKEYASRYPDIIRYNVNETNQGIPANIYKVRTMARGRYLTQVSGDDYWISTDKIEYETRFMDEHPEYVAAVSVVELRMDDSDVAYDTVPHDRSTMNQPYTLQDYEACKPFSTHGLFFRNYFLTEAGRDYFGEARRISSFVDDAVDQVLFLRLGPVYLLDIVTDANRILSSKEGKKNYNSRYSLLEKFTHHIDLTNAMYDRWGDEIDFSRWYARYYSSGFLSMLLSRDFTGFKHVFASIPKKLRRPWYRGVVIRSIPHTCVAVRDRFLRKH